MPTEGGRWFLEQARPMHVCDPSRVQRPVTVLSVGNKLKSQLDTICLLIISVKLLIRVIFAILKKLLHVDDWCERALAFIAPLLEAIGAFLGDLQPKALHRVNVRMRGMIRSPKLHKTARTRRCLFEVKRGVGTRDALLFPTALP